MTLLIVTAVAPEADAIRTAAGRSSSTVEVVGVGAAAAAGGTARLLALAEAAGRPYRAVLSAGIGGGFPGQVPVGGTVLAARSIAADLGADSPDGFIPLDELGFGSAIAAVDESLLAALRAALPYAVVGDVLTVNTVTGTAEGAKALAARYPAAVAEAMEGYGVACAATAAGLPFAELRTISNPVGPRDRAAWRLADAFASLAKAAATLPRALP
ncbi:futalosine hydrolase [Micromonospora sp. CPCC 205371]|nr:futalosine hydrolase [Micromonospora sp. CPCC 205371]